MMRSGILLLLLGSAGIVNADFVVTCDVGCDPVPSTDRSVNRLIVRNDAESIVLRWETGLTPDPKRPYLLLAGNPVEQDNLRRLGELKFSPDAGSHVATHAFPRAQIGHDTYIVALIRQGGNSSEIADWRVFHVRQASEPMVEPLSVRIRQGYYVDAEAEYMQVTSGRGELPVSTGGVGKVWWPIPTSYARQDIDIDGADTGVPGISILISPTWEGKEANWQEKLGDNLKEISGRFTQFDDFVIKETPPRELDMGGNVGEVIIRHFYSVITLHTNATQSNFSAKELGKGGTRTYFSHETSANLKQPFDPRLWASYSKREYSKDPVLMELIANTVEDRGTIPGLANVQTDDGDGGSVVYRVSFQARIQPFVERDTAFRAGFVHVDVIAARKGIGSVDAQDPQAPTGFCKYVPCLPGDSRINLNDAPDGYWVAPPAASIATGEGALQLLSGPTLIAARTDDESADPVDLPSKARFAVVAGMRSGALIRTKKEFLTGRYAQEIIPVNSYAQFVIRYTVAMVPEEIPLVGEEQEFPNPDSLVETETVVPKEEKGFFAELMDSLKLLGLPWLIIIGIVALAIFMPGFWVLINAIFKLITAIIRALTRLLNRRNSGSQ
jgi:hypothetical protein